MLFVHFFQGIENQIKVLLLFLKIVKGFLILSIKCFSPFQRLCLKILNLTMCGSRFVEGWNLDCKKVKRTVYFSMNTITTKLCLWTPVNAFKTKLLASNSTFKGQNFNNYNNLTGMSIGSLKISSETHLHRCEYCPDQAGFLDKIQSTDCYFFAMFGSIRAPACIKYLCLLLLGLAARCHAIVDITSSMANEFSTQPSHSDVHDK